MPEDTKVDNATDGNTVDKYRASFDSSQNINPSILAFGRLKENRQPLRLHRYRDGEEGVANERPHPMKDKKLTPIYEGKLTRDAISMALKELMQQPDLSYRIAAKRAGVSKSALQRVMDGKASIDQGLEVLEALGCVHEVRLELTVSAHEALTNG